MRLAGKITLAVAAGVLVLVMVLQATDLLGVANALAPIMWLLLVVGLVLWLVGRSQEKKKTPTAGR